MKTLLALFAFIALAAGAFGAHAQEAYESIPKPWQLGFQPPVTDVMEKLDLAHDFLLVIITFISLFVLAVLVYICIRFSRKNNPVPSKTAHNTRLEIIWTVIPIIILVVIAIPSLRIHYYMNEPKETEMTLKVVGYQWYWHYEYPDHGGFGFDSYMKKDAELQSGDHRLLSVDNRVVLPVDTKIKVLMTGADVIHAWAVPAFGVKRDAMPGRLNESWFEAKKIGTYYGQCSELCGVGHGFMPIVVDIVSKEDFAAWVASKQQEAGIDTTTAVAPLAQPENAAEQASPEPRVSEEKERSKEVGEGKPSVPAPKVIPPASSKDSDKNSEKK